MAELFVTAVVLSVAFWCTVIKKVEPYKELGEALTKNYNKTNEQ